jgi:FtsH-binding integral membrane protein
MSSKNRSKPKKEEEIETRIPITERKYFNLIYSIVVYTLFAIGVILIILSYSVLQQGYAIFIAFGVLGLAIILFTMRSSFRHSAPQPSEEKEEEDDGLKMRTR